MQRRLLFLTIQTFTIKLSKVRVEGGKSNHQQRPRSIICNSILDNNNHSQQKLSRPLSWHIHSLPSSTFLLTTIQQQQLTTIMPFIICTYCPWPCIQVEKLSMLVLGSWEGYKMYCVMLLLLSADSVKECIIAYHRRRRRRHT